MAQLSHSRRADAVPIGDLVRTVRRALPVLIVCGLIGAALGLVLVSRSPVVYTATSTVLVADAPMFLIQVGAPGAKRYTMDTEAARMVSAPVVEAARRVTGDADAAERVDIAAVPTTKVLKVTYSSTDAAAAGQAASAMTAAYLQARQAALEARRQQRIDLIGKQLATLNDRLEATLKSPTAAQAVTQRALRASIAREIAVRRAESRRVGASSVYPGQILRSTGTTVAQRPNPLVPAARGLAFGVLAGAALAALGASRLGSPREVERLLRGTPVIRLRRRRRSRDDAAAPAPRWDPIASRLLHDPPETVLVSRVGRWKGDPTPFVAEELSGVLSAHGRSTRFRPSGTTRYPSALVPIGTTDVVAGDPLEAEAGSVQAAEARHLVLVATSGTRRRALSSAARRASALGATINGIVLLPGLPSRARIGAAPLGRSSE